MLSVNAKDIIKDLKNSEDTFDFSNLDENHGIFSNKNKKVTGIFKAGTPKSNWLGDFFSLRSKAYSFKCKDDSESKNKLKGISESESKHFKFEEFKNCLEGEDDRKECDFYINRSINHEMYLQNSKKSALSLFDDKQCYINETESKPWE